MKDRIAAWLEALSAYRHPRVAAMLFLGFSAGLPFPLVFATLSALLNDAGIDKKTIGRIQEEAYRAGAMVRVSGPNIIISPPLVLSEADTDVILNALDAGLASVA